MTQVGEIIKYAMQLKIHMKVNVVALFNDKEENYLKINVENINSEVYIKKLIEFLDELKISHHLGAEPEILSAKYKEWIGAHEFFRTKDYIMHIIFSKNYMSLIIKCSLKKRKKLIEILTDHFSFEPTE